jgi:hypothetical protein
LWVLKGGISDFENLILWGGGGGSGLELRPHPVAVIKTTHKELYIICTEQNLNSLNVSFHFYSDVEMEDVIRVKRRYPVEEAFFLQLSALVWRFIFSYVCVSHSIPLHHYFNLTTRFSCNEVPQ